MVGELEHAFRLIVVLLLHELGVDDADVLGEAVDRVGDPIVQLFAGLVELVEDELADIGVPVPVRLVPSVEFREKLAVLRMSSPESTALSSVLARELSIRRNASRFSESSLCSFICGTSSGGFVSPSILSVNSVRALVKFATAWEYSWSVIPRPRWRTV